MLQLRSEGRAEFQAAVQARISAMMLVDADGEPIRGWGLEPAPLDPALWREDRYVPNPDDPTEAQGLYFNFNPTRADEPTAVVAGVSYLNREGAVLAYEPLLTPYIVSRQSQALLIQPVMRVFGTVRSPAE